MPPRVESLTSSVSLYHSMCVYGPGAWGAMHVKLMSLPLWMYSSRFDRICALEAVKNRVSDFQLRVLRLRGYSWSESEVEEVGEGEAPKQSRHLCQKLISICFIQLHLFRIRVRDRERRRETPRTPVGALCSGKTNFLDSLVR